LLPLIAFGPGKASLDSLLKLPDARK
jgi:hypothetical protein